MPKIRTSHGPRGKKWKVCLGMLPVLNLEWLHFGQVTLSPLNTIQSFAQTSKTNSGIRYCLITLLASWYEVGRRLPWRRMECQSCRFLENASLLEKDERKTNQTDEQQSQNTWTCWTAVKRTAVGNSFIYIMQWHSRQDGSCDTCGIWPRYTR